MKINYTNILNKNMINVFKDVLLNIQKNGLQEDHHLYITFDTNNKNIKIPKWLKEKFIKEMTIVIQYEYWNLKIKKNFFNIGLSFDDIKTDLEISYDSVISFADPYANFGLRLIPEVIHEDKTQLKKTKNKSDKSDNIIDFKSYRKN
jgi:uncharacterized protein